MKRFYSLIIIFFLLSQMGFSIDNLKFETINNINGLSHNTVQHIMQDKKGFMWVSTINGLNRYDGRRFIVMLPEFNLASLSKSKIKRTYEDKNGYIWVFLTSDIVNCYDTHTESFINYTQKDGVDNFKDILIASNGDTWLWGNKQGACRIEYKDGQSFTSFFNESNIQTNIVNFVFEDSKKQIWLGSNNGLYLITGNETKLCSFENNNLNFHSATETDKHIYFFTHNNYVIQIDKVSQKVVSKIEILSNSNNFQISQTTLLNNKQILITSRQGTYILNTSSSHISEAKALFGGNELKKTRIITDNKENRWVYNRSGNIWRYNPQKEKFDKIELIPSSLLPVIDLERYDIYCDSRNITWITTYGNGLFAIYPNTGEISHFTTANSRLKTNYLLSVTEDSSGEIWVGTEHTGITKISLVKYRNRVFTPNPDKNKIEDKIIRTIHQDKDGDIWVGTKSGNIYVFDKNLEKKRTFTLPQGMPYFLAEDTLGNKWIGTKGNGLMILKKNKSDYHNYTPNSIDTSSLSNNNIYSILRDSKGRMWVGAFDGGLLLAEQKDGKIVFKKLSGLNETLKSVRCLLQDSSGLIWVGGNNGVIVFDPDKILENPSNFKLFQFKKDNPKSLNSNEVKVIFEDSNKQIWIGTSGRGINLVIKDHDNKSYNFKHFTTEEGLVNNVVQSIEEDNNKNLWISTENGISKFSLHSQLFENHNFSETWEGNLFCESSSFKRQNGELMFGSYNGLYIFDPTTFENVSPPIRVILTSLQINGTPIIPNGADSPLSCSITETSKIKLKHWQNSFAIEFSSLNFQNAYSDRYTYILEGYDDSWNPLTQYNIASYKNIPAGKYTFKVRAINNSGIMDENETALEIIIIPPFWRSGQAILLYIIFFIIAAFFTVRLALKMNKLHNAVEVEKRLTEYRLRFFTNISHEFRTPLTIIRGSIESISEMPSLSPTLRKQINVLEKSSSRLMRLIDQLLEFRKLQKDTLELALEYTDIVEFFHEIYEIFSNTANSKHIHYTFSSDRESYVTLLDKSKMNKVLFNLLSNAFKHTPENGYISVNLEFDSISDSFRLVVSDSGIGIPEDKRNLLFQRFKQINYTSSGIGIGLHLTFELISIHKGSIEYCPSEWNGASFIVSVPVSDSIYSGEKILNTQQSLTSEDKKIVTKEDFITDTEIVNPSKDLKDYKILIIEDDEDIRTFLTSQLENYFNILTAIDGQKGLDTATKEQLDLIICDVMMPIMDGFETTKKLKLNFETSHIPIILLTAHSSVEHQVEGINAGADSYIVKPFSIRYLFTRIVKLIEQREKLQLKFSQEAGINQITFTTTDRDKEFMEKIHSIIDNNLDNAEFSIEEFANSVNLGRTMFYKKVKGITGYSPNEYIKIIRLKKAAELLRISDLNISEIAYKVGFSDPFYFSRCFKEQFETTPTQFRTKSSVIK